MTTNEMPAKNTDRELWRESDDRSQTTPSIHVTQDGGIGINVGGTVIVMPLRKWHELANRPRVPVVTPSVMTSRVADEVAKIACGTPIIAKPEQPPFAPKQFVRIKSSGTILNVARCEKRVVHGALRWVVDDLNGMRAFAADCELIKNMELVNAETGEAVIHLEPKTVRYACTKLAAVGDGVKFTGRASPDPFKVVSVDADGMCDLDFLDGEFYGTFHASKLEFVPDVTPVEATEFDFDEAANKAAAVILEDLDDETTITKADWISDAISAQIRPGVQALHELQAQKLAACSCAAIMDTPETHDQNKDMKPDNPFWSPAFDDVMRRTGECIKLRRALSDIARPGDCGCRPCRGQCRTKEALEIDIDGLRTIAREALAQSIESLNKPRETPLDPVAELELEQLRERLAVAMSLLGQCDNRMFLVGDFEVRKTAGGWTLYRPLHGALLADAKNVKVFSNPVQAALRAKELADVGKVGAA